LWPTDFRRDRYVNIIGHGICPECERGGKDGPEYSFWESHFVGKLRIIYGNLFAARQTNDVRKIGWSSGKKFAMNTPYFSNRKVKCEEQNSNYRKNILKVTNKLPKIPKVTKSLLFNYYKFTFCH
jgi:hypothetical protein